MRDSFVFYKEWRDALVGVPDGVRMEVYDAIIEYGVTGEVPELKPMAELAFRFVKTRMDKDAERYDDVLRKRSEAGKKGMEKRWNHTDNTGNSDNKNNNDNTRNTDNMCYQAITGDNKNNLYDNDNDEENNKEKYSVAIQKEKEKTIDTDNDDSPPLNDEQQAKVEKGRKYKYAEYVTLTRDEYAKLCEAHTEEGARRMIEILDNYKGQNGRRYKSDYRAILNWVVDRYNEEITKPAYGNGRKNIASEERATAAAGVIGRLFATNEPVES